MKYEFFGVKDSSGFLCRIDYTFTSRFKGKQERVLLNIRTFKCNEQIEKLIGLLNKYNNSTDMQVGSFFSSFLDAESDKEWKNKYIVIMQNYEKENAEELIEQELALIQLGK